MSDFYAILGIPRTATSTEIRMAYKRMAMQYHPDRNAGDKEAEEIFKIINEAYHTLSDPLRKARYDQQGTTHDRQVIYDDAREQEMKRRRYYEMRHAQQNKYVIDKNYYRIQALAFFGFFLMAGIAFAIANIGSYFFRQHQEEAFRETTIKLNRVNGLFDSGRVAEAFDLMALLREDDPLETRFIFARDSLVDALRKRAEKHYHERQYKDAIGQFMLLQHYESPTRVQTLQMIANTQYYLGNYAEAIRAMKHLHSQDARNLELIYSIARINLDNLENPEEAKQYFTLGKKLFRENMIEIYGEAFEMQLEPANAPDVYFEIYLGSARANLMLQQYDEALTDSDLAIYLRRTRVEGYDVKMKVCASAKKRQLLCETVALALALKSAEAPAFRRQYCR